MDLDLILRQDSEVEQVRIAHLGLGNRPVHAQDAAGVDHQIDRGIHGVDLLHDLVAGAGGAFGIVGAGREAWQTCQNQGGQAKANTLPASGEDHSIHPCISRRHVA